MSANGFNLTDEESLEKLETLSSLDTFRFFNLRKIYIFTSLSVFILALFVTLFSYYKSKVFSVYDIIMLIMIFSSVIVLGVRPLVRARIFPLFSISSVILIIIFSLVFSERLEVAGAIFMIFFPFVFFFNGFRRGILYSAEFILVIAAFLAIFRDGAFVSMLSDSDKYLITGIIFDIPLTMLLIYSRKSYDESLLKSVLKTEIYDKMLNLPNKNSLMRSFASKNQDFILAIVKIKNFPEISSLFGYKSSEKILCFVSGILSEMCRRDGYTCYKLMGHEFGVVIPVKDSSGIEHDAKICLDMLWYELLSYRMETGDKEIYLTYRIGASINSAQNSSRALLKADLALNMADKLLHNVFIYDESAVNEKDRVLSSGRLYNELFYNIKNGLLLTVYQPIVNSISGEIKWYEALLRVKTDKGYVSVYPYLSIAKNTGIYNELTRAVLKSVRKRLFEYETDVSVNITLSDISHPGFMEDVLSLCRDIGDRKGKLIIEIVESEELVEIDICRNFIAKVQELGGKIAIDDFGSGYSNFCNLLNLSFDIVKIDGSLIRSAENDPNALTMIESISAFCHKCGKQIVAEYVENESLHEIVKSNKIHFCQGYLFGMPS